ncbi:MAG TPA: universal stress protein [Syntrophales bacterium]|nr:universal stress protein [Syntrophales bacterium]
MIKRILMATDGSKTSVRALKTAVELAKKTEAKLILVGVIDNRLYVGRTMLPEDSPTRLAEPVEDFLMQAAGAYLADATRLCGREGIEPEIVIRTGHPVEEIQKEARRSKADLLVMGSHGQSGIGSVMGSVAFGILHGESRVPVLIVRK